MAMSDDIDRDMKKLMGELDDDMDISSFEQELHKPKRKIMMGSKGKIILLSLLVAAVVIIVAIMIPKGSDDRSPGDLNAVSARLGQIEKKLTSIDGLALRISDMENRENAYKLKTEELSNYIKSLMNHIDVLTKKVDALEIELAAVSAVKRAPVPKTTRHTEASPPDGTGYHTVQKGENLYRISLKYGMALEDLCAINGITPHDPIRPGQRLLVRP
jgi:LysM repeat protein